MVLLLLQPAEALEVVPMMTEEMISYHLSRLISDAMESKDEKSIAFIRSLWDDEPWEDIVEKFGTEGSVWVVWWADGINAFWMRSSESL